MNPAGVRARVTAFVITSMLVIGYLAVHYMGMSSWFSPPFVVHAHFRDSGGIFVGAEVDERGIRVGKVRAMHLAADGVVVDLALAPGTRIPSASTATVVDRSALGEQYVALTPPSGAGPYLGNGGVIPVTATAIPVPTQTLLTNLDALAKSVPRAALTTVLTQLSTALNGAGPKLGTILDSTSKITSTALVDLNNTITLIDQAQTVLNTQVDSGAALRTFSRNIVPIADTLRSLDPTFAAVLNSGVSASVEVTNLLDDTQKALPVLLGNLSTVSDVLAGRVPQLRKLLVTFPHALELGLTLVRYCDQRDANGVPVKSSCHYDPVTGLPAYSAHFTLQYATSPAVCTQGYSGTKRYLPNGRPVSGSGPSETSASPANSSAGCAASPTSGTPNVRGAQNAQDTSAASPDSAYYDPLGGGAVTSSGGVFAVTPDSAAAPQSLAELMTMGVQ